MLYYSNKVVWTKHVGNPNGCRIYYGDGNVANQPECWPLNLLDAVSIALITVQTFLSCIGRVFDTYSVNITALGFIIICKAVAVKNGNFVMVQYNESHPQACTFIQSYHLM